LKNKKKYGALISALVAIIIISPLDEIAIAALFGTAFFGFGSISFYLLMVGSSTVSITVWLWRKHTKNNVAKGFSPENLTKTNLTTK